MAEQSKKKTTTQPTVKKKVGRPLFDGKDEATVVRLLEEAFALGCTDLEACLYADIGKSTLYNYQDKNPKFLERKELLKERPVLQARNSVIQAMRTDGNLALKFLERKRKAEFSTQQQIDHTTNGKDLPMPILGGLSVQPVEDGDA
ncbi:hypothetical protein [Arthrobacter cavernae]|uniref:Uncharacterized protein n=1 Tax=Arthrobacter cavernae TaxID=2817681 RepID=A0A939HDB2_9MICC|nr:hypothetical protein [Arthrobacter cavernae]MBO1267079.1 hypothetical protein [Arthrobacter cavernae]